MQFSIVQERHKLSMISNALPEEYEKYHIAGSEARVLKGDFGAIIGQTFHEQDLYISFQILNLTKETWLRFPFENRLRLLFFVCEGDLTINIPSNSWKFTIKENQFYYMDFESIKNLSLKNMVISEGVSKFFVIQPLDTNYTIHKDANFQDQYFIRLCETLKEKAKTHY